MSGSVWQAFWGDLNRPETFASDPYGALTNQAGHVLLGGVAVCTVCVLWALLYSEMPYRWPTGLIVVGLYAALVEWWRQGWQRGDSLIDTAFVALGVAGPLVSLTEVRVRVNVEMQLQPWAFGLWLAGTVAALAVHVAPRIKRAYGGQDAE